MWILLNFIILFMDDRSVVYFDALFAFIALMRHRSDQFPSAVM